MHSLEQNKTCLFYALKIFDDIDSSETFITTQKCKRLFKINKSVTYYT